MDQARGRERCDPCRLERASFFLLVLMLLLVLVSLGDLNSASRNVSISMSKS
jgi:hypothetical protein